MPSVPPSLPPSLPPTPLTHRNNAVLLKLNIEAAERNKWTTKLAVFRRLEKLCNEFSKSGGSKGGEGGGGGGAGASALSAAAGASSAASGNGTISRGKLHTPVFESNVQIEVLDEDEDEKKGEGTAYVEEGRLDAAVTHKSSCVDGSKLTAALGFGSGAGAKGKGKQRSRKRKAGGGGGGGSKRKKSKSEKKGDKAIDNLATVLKEHGWAVCDNFISPEKVVEVRSEVEQLQPHFEESEIWVGKGA